MTQAFGRCDISRCPVCDGIEPQGSNCFIDDTDCISHTGDGNEATEFALSVDLSADVDQLLTCGGDGLLATLPTLLTNPPTVQAFRTSPQSIPNNTLTALTFNVEFWDTDTMHSLVADTNRITFTTAGKYLVTFLGSWRPQSGSTGIETVRLIEMRKNGTDILAMDTRGAINDGFGVFVGQNLIVEEQFSAADYVEVLVQQNIGSALQYSSESFSPVFTAYRMAA